ncbi:hypothetical protein [Flavobacterium sp. ASV13]|uniref:hypothetical protein n=1 Tax=Flavobacterium sp. ASV13 TaxID=1506583 RepID=UPI00054E4E2D|nr:hypothetical protein [Flavobacterium sp. ASV13]
MNAKQIARRLEFIKYFTLQKKTITLTINADVGQHTEIENEYVQLSGNFSFTFESIITDYAYSYDSNLKGRKLQIPFNKKPDENSPDFKLICNLNGLMTPAIANNYIKDGHNFKRYIFPSYNNYRTYSEWYSDTAMDIDKRDTRSYSMNIIVKEADPDQFEQFLNESYSQWKSRFTAAKNIAMQGDFYWLSLYDPRIYEYELSFDNRKAILNYMVYSLNWRLIIGGIDGINGVDEYELFESLIKNISVEDLERLYNYMFEVSGEKTNLQIYEDKLPKKLYDILLLILIKYFYSKKTLIELKNGFRKELLYPIGLYEENGPCFTFDLDENHNAPTGDYIIGAKYNISEDNNKIKINSALRYRLSANGSRIEYQKFRFIGIGEELDYKKTVYITSFISNQKLKGIEIPYGSAIPIPAFALKWIIDENEDEENIIDLIQKTVAITGMVLPIYQLTEGVNIFYNIIGIGFTIFGNALEAGVKDQIEKYDKSKSTSEHPYTLGQDFLDTYYLLSAIYGGINLRKSIEKGKTPKEKIKILFEFETLLGMKGTLGDINSYMEEHNENLDLLIHINTDMIQLQIDYDRYKISKK